MSDLRIVHNGTFVSTLYRAAQDRPALVIGGGPSAPEQLAALGAFPKNAVILSANAHAFRLGIRPHYIVCKDHRHTETQELLEPVMRKYGVPLVSRQHWADFRLGAWPVQGNSGMMAIGLAALLGCRPIVPIGFDCYQGGTYFYAPADRNVSKGLSESHWRSRYQRLQARLTGAMIRPPLGALFNLFPAYRPDEAPGPFHMPTSLQPYETMKWSHVRAKRAFLCKHSRTEIPAGYVFPADEAEVALYERGGLIEKVDSLVAP